MNEGISAPIGHKLLPYQIDAIRHMEREYLAYLPAKQKGIRWGELYHLTPDKKFFKVKYNECYGIYLTYNADRDIPTKEELKEVDKKGLPVWTDNTYCNISVATFLYFFMGYNYTDNKLKISYGDNDYLKHPVSIAAQSGANGTALRLADGTFNKYTSKYGLVFTHVADKAIAASIAHYGGMVIAVWYNPKGIGHVSTVIGGKELHIPDYNNPMIYNIGSKNGYMSLVEGFYNKKQNKNILFYKVEKV